MLAKECCCNDAIGADGTVSVERAKSRAQALAFLPGEFMESRSRWPPVYGAPQPSRCVRARVEVPVERQLGHVEGADTWWLPQPNAMIDCANAQHRVPTILDAANLAGRKFEGARRCGHLLER
ncbi:hypothetical protein MA20_37960 [Bradyrhizobium japonicum]|uniref:Uncharacterized protein n=1 Tax=Bradyrhizobium japonicum TaxID=375 RepID=A0A0A3XMU3_BRAJP|nr:hypothetical protein MA20_37960 [Bradyrhizobium japonicum]